MTRPSYTPLTVLAAIAAAGLALATCGRVDDETADVTGDPARDVASVQTTGAEIIPCTGLLARDSILTVADLVEFQAADSVRLRFAADGSEPTGPFARIAAATSDPVPGVLIRARVVADSAFAPLGYAGGTNYIYVDSTADGWRSAVVPTNVEAQPVCRRVHVGTMSPDTAAALRAGFFDEEGIDSGDWYACRTGPDNCCCGQTLAVCERLRHPARGRLTLTPG